MSVRVVRRGVIAALTAVSCVSSVGALGWWLSGRFRSVETSFGEKIESLRARQDVRHEENLRRFGQISVALARLGYRNGNGG